MHLTTLHDLFLIPVGLAVAFLLWFLWSVTKELSNRRESTAQQPMISIQVNGQYAMRGLPPRADALRPQRPTDVESKEAWGKPRGRMQPPTAPTLGMRSSIPSQKSSGESAYRLRFPGPVE
jgi:hypothetical protein